MILEGVLIFPVFSFSELALIWLANSDCKFILHVEQLEEYLVSFLPPPLLNFPLPPFNYIFCPPPLHTNSYVLSSYKEAAEVA